MHIASRDIDDQRIWQSDWTRAFCLIIWKPEFSQIFSFHRKTKSCNVFSFWLHPAKRNGKILWKVKKLHSEPFLQILGQTRIFLENPTHYFLFLDFYCCAEFQKKTKEQNSRKVGYRRTDGRIHGRTDKPLPGVQKQQRSKVNYIKVSWLNIYPQSCKKYLQ